MKHAVLILAFLPNLVFAGPVTFTFDVNAKDALLPAITGQMSFTFDDRKQRVVEYSGQYGSYVSYGDQNPFTFTSSLGAPHDTVYAVGARVINTGYGASTVIVSVGGSSFNVDDKGYYSQYGISIDAQFLTGGIPLLDADAIVNAFQDAEKLTFRAYSISYTNFPQPASNFVSKYYYVDENVRLLSVSREAEVPEPATLASLILGLGLIGFIHKRRS